MGGQEEKGWLETTKSWAPTVAGNNTLTRLHSDDDEVQTEFIKNDICKVANMYSLKD